MDCSYGGGPSCSPAAQEQISCFFGEQVTLPFSSSAAGCSERSGFPITEKLELEIEEVAEEGAKSLASTRGGAGSKRSRAAEVHNLSEKRRRSRINEKMRALQNLIPNSNKTDKASMLDEAIEYLKQLQLQVQMLSMRNGLNLHDMYLSGMVQAPLQPSEICMGFSGENRIALNMSKRTLPLNQESFSHNHQASSHQIQTMVPGLTTSQETFQLPISTEMLDDDIVLQQQLDAGPTARSTTGRGRQLLEYEEGDEDVMGSGSVIPPHELLWRRREASFSVQEGIGRSRRKIKGRDLSCVRDAIWQRTGFED